LVAMWGLFIVARLHTYKFKNFSSNIVKVTNILLVILIVLSLLGYVVIFIHSSPKANVLQGIESESAREPSRSFDSFDENYY